MLIDDTFLRKHFYTVGHCSGGIGVAENSLMYCQHRVVRHRRDRYNDIERMDLRYQHVKAFFSNNYMQR